MKKAQDNSLPMVQQGASMMLHAGTGASNMMIPDKYMLIPQRSAWPQPNASAQLSTNHGKHHGRNQRRKDRHEQIATNRSIINERPPVVQAIASPSAQPVSSPRAEGGGYHTEDYARMKANKLAMRGGSNLPADILLKDVKKLYHYFYGLSRVLVTPALDSTSAQLTLNLRQSWFSAVVNAMAKGTLYTDRKN